ncbi:MAG: DUF5723 family protein [Candidatus Kapabacteria bacterium]|jgi:hypothetical protein|nr:DUF5723 family protein [Candidatus Kapabacteria bacterium]
MKYIISILLIAAFSFTTAAAQYGSFGVSDAQSMGMGNTHNSFGYGIMSVGKNPALLLSPKSDSSRFIDFQILGLSASASTNSVSFDLLNNYFVADSNGNAQDINTDQKQEILDAFSDEGKFAVSSALRPIAISWMPSREIGVFAFTMDFIASGDFVMPQSAMDFILYGNKENSSYSFDELFGKTWALQTYALSYAREIYTAENENTLLQNVSGGISLKMVQGLAYFGTEEVSTEFSTGEYNRITGHVNILTHSAFSPDLGYDYDYENKETESNAGLFNEPAGSGFGVDIGFSAELNIGLMIGLAITDIGSIAWDTHCAAHEAETEIYMDAVDADQIDSISNSFDLDGYEIGGFDTALPTALRLGVAYDMTKNLKSIPGNLIVAVDYNQGFNDAPGNSTTPRISLGAQWRQSSPYIPVISTGFTNDRIGKFRWSMGLGFITSGLDIRLATYDLLSLIDPNSSPVHVSAAFSMIWRINHK